MSFVRPRALPATHVRWARAAFIVPQGNGHRVRKVLWGTFGTRQETRWVITVRTSQGGRGCRSRSLRLEFGTGASSPRLRFVFRASRHPWVEARDLELVCRPGFTSGVCLLRASRFEGESWRGADGTLPVDRGLRPVGTSGGACTGGCEEAALVLELGTNVVPLVSNLLHGDVHPVLNLSFLFNVGATVESAYRFWGLHVHRGGVVGVPHPRFDVSLEVAVRRASDRGLGLV